jgi:hypothetical protein
VVNCRFVLHAMTEKKPRYAAPRTVFFRTRADFSLSVAP